MNISIPIHKFLALVFFVFAIVACPGQAADDASPTGLWKTFDDHTGDVSSEIRIYSEGGILFGRIERVLDPNHQADVCDRCRGERKNEKIIGMVLMRGLRLESGEYRGGQIIDPRNGETYRCTARVTDGGKKLVVRGFIGITLLGRSETWERVR